MPIESSNPFGQPGAWAPLFQQSRRFLRLEFSERAGFEQRPLDEQVLVAGFRGQEAISEVEPTDVLVVSERAGLPLKQLVGQPASLVIVDDRGGDRRIGGLVDSASLVGADGGWHLYRLRLVPHLTLLRHRHNSRYFQSKTIRDIVDTVLNEHRATNPMLEWEWQLREHYPIESLIGQYDESDLAFLQRRLCEAGIWFYVTSQPGDGAGQEQHDAGYQRIVFTDDVDTLPANRAAPVRYHRAAATEQDDTIVSWGSTRSLHAGKVSLSSYDYKAVQTRHSQEVTNQNHGDAGNQLVSGLEAYHPQTLYVARDSQLQQRLTRLRIEALEAQAKQFEGAGSVRSFATGTWFELVDYPGHAADSSEARQFVLLTLTHVGRNNLLGEPQEKSPLAEQMHQLLQDELPVAAHDKTGLTYRNRFTAIRRGIRYVTPFTERLTRPTAPTATVALVVGPASEEIHTDELGRLKLQFPWQRPQDHPDGTANEDDRSFTWVRQAQPWAGQDWGGQFLARVGDEVVVLFENNDIDRPVAISKVTTGRNLPPRFSATGGLPGNKALAGFKTRELKGGRFNELLFDDTSGELRARLASEHAKTELNLGYLVHPRDAGKGEARGEGFELRTDAAGAIRAAQGLLVTTDARQGATGQQLSREEIVRQLESALELAKSLSQSAEQQGAEGAESDYQQQVQAKVAGLGQGQNGQGGGQGGGDTAQQPVIAASAPAGMALSTPQGMTLHTGKNLDMVSGRDLNQSIAGRFITNIGSRFSLFVAGAFEKTGKAAEKVAIRLIAASGKIRMQAQSDDIEIAADKSIVLSAVENHVLVTAKEHITLTCGGAYIKLQGGNIEIGGPGTFTVKAASHSMEGPASMNADSPAFPKGQFERKFALVRTLDGKPRADCRYRITKRNGEVVEGRTNAQGETSLLTSDQYDLLDIQFFDDKA